MHRPYYQQSLGLQGHRVTDWVHWLQVYITLMPVGLSLQTSLYLLTLRINILLCLSFIFFSLFCLSLCHPNFSLLLIFAFNLISLTKLLLKMRLICSALLWLVAGWSVYWLCHTEYTASCHLCCLVWFFLSSVISLHLCLHGLLDEFKQTERWATERRTGPMLSSVKRERVDTKYSPPLSATVRTLSHLQKAD